MGLIWEKMMRPVMFGLDAERAHELGIEALRLGLAAAFTAGETANFGGIAAICDPTSRLRRSPDHRSMGF